MKAEPVVTKHEKSWYKKQKSVQTHRQTLANKLSNKSQLPFSALYLPDGQKKCQHIGGSNELASVPWQTHLLKLTFTPTTVE